MTRIIFGSIGLGLLLVFVIIGLLGAISAYIQNVISSLFFLMLIGVFTFPGYKLGQHLKFW